MHPVSSDAPNALAYVILEIYASNAFARQIAQTVRVASAIMLWIHHLNELVAAIMFQLFQIFEYVWDPQG